MIAIVLIGIIFALFYFASSVGTGIDKPIATTAFEKHVQDRTETEIKGKDYEEAQKGFVSILNELETEGSITLGDGSKNLSDSEISKSRQIAFYEYAPIFTKYANTYFSKSSWDDSALKSMKNESENLLAFHVAESGTTVDSDLKKIIKSVDDYYSAWKVANSASHCTTVGGIATIAQNAQKYKVDPLVNNSSLLSALNSAETNAKNSVIKIISNYCNSVSDNYKNHTDYQAFNKEYEQACSRIDEYKNKYDYPNNLQSVRRQLDSADSNALSYFKKKKQDMEGIISNCNSISNNYRTYSDRSSFMNAYNNACNRIQDYRNTYSYPDNNALNSAKRRMDDAYNYWK